MNEHEQLRAGERLEREMRVNESLRRSERLRAQDE